MKKRFLAVLLTMAMLFSVLPASALAAEGTADEAAACTVTEGCTLEAGHDGECVLPDEPETQEDDSNSYYEFEDVYGIDDDTVIMPLDGETTDEMSGSCGATEGDSVTWKLEQNNEGSESPTYTLTISGTGETAKISGDFKIDSETKFSSIRAYITKVVVGEGITTLGNSMFADFKGLTEISLPNSLEVCGTQLFQNCYLLKSVHFGPKVKTIGAGFISDNDAYDSNKHRSIFDTDGDSALATLTVDTSNLYFVSEDNVLYNKDRTELIYACSGTISQTYTISKSLKYWPGALSNSGIEEISFESGITSVSNGLLYNCKTVKKATIPDTVSVIGANAFTFCDALSEVTFSNALKTIGAQAFYGCPIKNNLMILNDGVITVGKEAFRGNKFDRIVLPASLTTLGQESFTSDKQSTDFAGLQSVIFRGDISSYTATFNKWGKDSLHSIVLEKDGSIPKNFFSTISSDKVICYYATMKPSDNTVFKSASAITNGGTFPTDTEFTLGVLATPIKEGKIFSGWYTDTDFKTEAVKTDDVYKAASSTTYYAKWVSKITFDANGGTLPEGSTSPVSIEEGKALSSVSESYALPTPTNGNATFVGWNTAADGSGDPVTTSTVPTGNATYYAIWGTSAGETYSIYPINEQTYTGSPITPTVYLVDKNGNKFAASSVAYENNTSAGTATAKVTVSGQEYSVNFTIKKADYDMSGISFNDATYDYDGTERELIITGILPDGVSVSYSNNKLTDVGSISATASFSGDTNNYNEIESKTATLTIKKVKPTISISASPKTLTGSGTVTLTVSGLPDGASAAPTCDGLTVTANSDGTYSVSLPNETKDYTFTVSYAGDTNHEEATATCKVSVTYKGSDGGGSSSSGSSSSNTTTETVTNKDGSTTTTVTDKKTGTVTVTTKYKDGSTLVVETKKDGTVTTTETRADGVKVKTVDEPGEDVTAAVTIPRSVGTAIVTIPADTTPGTVAVDAETGEIVKLSVPTEDGMTVKLDGSANLVLEDRSKNFTDTNNHWAEDAIDFATAHGMFSGTSATTFTPDSPMTRAMLMTVLARFDGEDTSGGSVWYEKGMEWAKANGVSDGSNPNGSITREQFATMLWRYAGSPAVSGSLTGFSDHAKVSGYATDAMRWAVSTGIIGGMGNGTLAPQGNATRAQVATMLMRFVENLTK